MFYQCKVKMRVEKNMSYSGNLVETYIPHDIHFCMNLV